MTLKSKIGSAATPLLQPSLGVEIVQLIGNDAFVLSGLLMIQRDLGSTVDQINVNQTGCDQGRNTDRDQF